MSGQSSSTGPDATLLSARVSLPASGLVVEVPEADAVVGPWRNRLDELAPVGVPAHVTCLFPVGADDIDDAGLATIADAVRGTGSFDYRFGSCAWFGEEVLWLAPDEPEPFVALTHALTAALPHLQPYEGRFDRVIPHLTVGHKCPTEALRSAEADITPNLPVSGRATQLSLFTPHGAAWTRTATFELA